MTTIELKGQVKYIDYENSCINIAVYDDMSKLKENEIIKIKCNRAKRTLNQNALYWLFCTFVSNILRGNGNIIKPDQVHDIFKNEIISGWVEMPNGQVLRIPGSTANKTKSDFGKYLEAAMSIAIEWGVPVEIFQSEYEKELKNREEIYEYNKKR